jgi:protein SCO1/2
MLAGCDQKREDAVRRYELVGQVLAVRPDTGELLIKHEDIKNFMPGMTMPFKVKDRAAFDRAAAGDLVKATLAVSGTDAWLETLHVTGSLPLADTASVPPASFVTPVRPGDEPPDTELTDQRGEPVSLPAWRGSAVAVTFIYLRCPLPQYCPLLDRRFVEVQRAVHNEPALRERSRLLSVSFDPEADTPARMRAHAERLGADPRYWRFATAPREVIERFAAAFGVNVIREADGTITHNMRTAVIAPNGRVTHVFDGTDWAADDVVQAMRAALE